MNILDIIGLIALFIFPVIPFLIYGRYKIKQGRIQDDKTMIEDGYLYSFFGFVPMANIVVLLAVVSLFSIIGLYSLPIYVANKMNGA